MDPVRAPQPQTEYALPHVVLSHYAYERSGTFTLPALPGDHLSVVLQGANVMARRLDGRREQGTIRPGDVTIVPRGADSTWTPHISTPNRTLHLMLLPSLWETVAPTADTDLTQVQLRDDFATADRLIEQITLALWSAAADGDNTAVLYAETLTQTLAMHLLRGYAVHRVRADDVPPGRGFQRSLDYIETYLADDLSLETLAALEGLSPYHFARMFKDALGQPPHQYVITRRVERARHLLDTTRLSLAQVAAEVGFANQSHLTRHFKRIIGVTPGQYRIAS